MIKPKKVKAIVHAGQLAPGQKKCRIAFHCLIEQLSRLHEVAARQGIKSHGAEPKRLRPSVKVERSEIGSWSLLDRRFFRRRKFGLQLISDRFRDFALDGEDVGEIAIIGLGPKMGIVSRID